MSNWRQKSVEHLAADPVKWVRLCEVFAEVEEGIPAHLALRRVEPGSGLNTARWRLFLGHIRSLVERHPADDSKKASYRWLRTDMVRLRPHDVPCEVCGGPRYLTGWNEHGGPKNPRPYACLSCAAPPPAIVVEPTPEPVVDPPPVVVIAPPPAELGVIERVEIAPEPVVVEPKLPPRPKKIRKERRKKPPPLVVLPPLVHLPVLPVIEAAELSAIAPAKSVQDVWEAFKFFAGDIGVYLPSIDNQTQSDRRLRAALRKALEAGLAFQFHLFRERLADELRRMDFRDGCVDNGAAEKLFLERAEIWVPPNITSLNGSERNRWCEMIGTAFRYGAMYMLRIFAEGRLEVFSSEMEVLVRKYFQQRPKTFKDRWMSIRKQMNFKRVG